MKTFIIKFLISNLALPLFLAGNPRVNDALELIDSSEYILIGSMHSYTSYYNDGNIYTDYEFEVHQNIKGELGNTFSLTFKGGNLNGIHEHYCDHPKLENTEYLLFLNFKSNSYNLKHHSIINSNGYYFLKNYINEVLNKNIELNFINNPQRRSLSQISNNSYASIDNLIKNRRNNPTRWTISDQGKSIGYYIDMDVIPQGYNKDEIRELVRSSFDEWSTVTNLKFKYLEDISLNKSVRDLNNEILLQAIDGQLPTSLIKYNNCIVLQLHSTYENDYTLLGSAYFNSYPYYENSSYDSDYGYGGEIDGIEYDKNVFGWLIINHEVFDKNTSSYDLKATIVHEIGHVLGLYHSTEDPYESDSVLTDSVMYYSGTIGKTWNEYLNIWDISNIQQAYQTNLYLPYSFDRNLDFYRFSNGEYDFNTGINKHDLLIFDLDGGNLELIDLGSSYNPRNYSYNFYGNDVFITREAGPVYNQDIRENTLFSNSFFRIKDGDNYSPVYELKIQNLLYDSNENGISDEWENFYNLPFNLNRDSDFDNDGFSNYEEYLMGSDPTTFSKNQSFKLLENEFNFNAKAGDIYLLKNSTDLINFTLNNDLRLEVSSNEDIDGDGKLDIYEDINNNGILDRSEDFDGDGRLDVAEDLNNNGILDTAEPFVDSNNNGSWDATEPYIDLDGNGYYNGPEIYIDTNLNGQWDQGDIFIDWDNDGYLDQAEIYIDSNFNGLYDFGEFYIDGNFNGLYDYADLFYDYNNNGRYDNEEYYIDSNFNGIYDSGDYLFDQNNNGIRDYAETFTDLNNNGMWDGISEDVDGDGNLDIFEDFNNNGVLDLNTEDLDNDGNLDVAEDLDGDDLLDISLNLKLSTQENSKEFYQIQIFD
jgi:hypothetical protein